MSPLEGILSQLLETNEELQTEIKQLIREEPIFGMISTKYIKCGKKNCKCRKGKQYHHGPYYYLRREPDYTYNEYLGKNIPQNIMDKIDIGKKIKLLEKKKKQIDKTVEKLGKFLVKSDIKQ